MVEQRAFNDKVEQAENENQGPSKLLEDSGFAPPEKKAAPDASDKNAAVAATRVSGEIIPDRYIVTLKDKPLGARPDIGGAVQNKIDRIAQGIGIGHNADIQVYKHALNGFAGTLSPQQVAALRVNPDVANVEPDRKIFVDPKSMGNPTTQTAGEMPPGVKRIDGDKSPTANTPGGVDVDVAVIDTGINLKHKELNVVDNVSFVDGVTSGDDDNGHGSHVAGTIGARSDGSGVVGVAPGARLWAVKVLGGDGGGTLSGVAAGIDYVTKNADKIEVANMSLGGRFKSQVIDDAISNSVDAGVTYIVAAGNDSIDAENFTPANHPKVMAVSAVTDTDGIAGGKGSSCDWSETDDKFASFSNHGEKVKIAAPGSCVQSTWKADGTTADTYNSISGTSMASPHVAGAAALVKAKEPLLKPDQVYKKLLDEAKAQSDPDYGFTGDPDKFPEPLLNVGKF